MTGDEDGKSGTRPTEIGARITVSIASAKFNTLLPKDQPCNLTIGHNACPIDQSLLIVIPLYSLNTPYKLRRCFCTHSTRYESPELAIMRRGDHVAAFNAFPQWCTYNDAQLLDIALATDEQRGNHFRPVKDLGNSEDGGDPPLLLTVPKDMVLSAEAIQQYAKVDKNFRDIYDAAGHQVINLRNTDMISSILAHKVHSPIVWILCCSCSCSTFIHLPTSKDTRAELPLGHGILTYCRLAFLCRLCGRLTNWSTF